MSLGDGGENYYQVLGVGTGATAAQVKQAYRRCVLATHPDLNPGLMAADRFRRIRRAYEVLADPDERLRYDRLRGIGDLGLRSQSHRRSFGRLFDSLFRNLKASLNSTARLSDAVRAEASRTETAPDFRKPRHSRRRAG